MSEFIIRLNLLILIESQIIFISKLINPKQNKLNMNVLTLQFLNNIDLIKKHSIMVIELIIHGNSQLIPLFNIVCSVRV
jgi:hypothetical protein